MNTLYLLYDVERIYCVKRELGVVDLLNVNIDNLCNPDKHFIPIENAI